MDFTKIANVAGKGGLYKILKPSRTGVIVESLDEHKKKLPVSATGKMSILGEISIYVTEGDGSMPLPEIYKSIFDNLEGKPCGLSKTSPDGELWDFMKKNVPNYDTEKVYLSDVKKLVTWYDILVREAPELFEVEEETAEETEAKSDEKEKPAAKKASASKASKSSAKGTKAKQPKAASPKNSKPVQSKVSVSKKSSAGKKNG